MTITSIKPLVSIMIPTYNQATLLPFAIESALSQDYPNLEVIVSDDSSIDSTAIVVQRYLEDSRIRYIKQNRNLGRVKNYETLLTKYALGKWVLNLDGDDYLIDNKFISHAIDRVVGKDDIVMVVGGFQKLSKFGLEAPELPVRSGWKRVNGIKYMLTVTPSIPLPHLATLYRREIGCKVGCYKDDILGADRQCLLLIAQQGDVLLTDRLVGVWRIHDSNQSSIIDHVQQIASLRTYTKPFQEAKKVGVSKDRLACWRDNALAEYAVSYANVCITTRNLRHIIRMFEILKIKYPVVYRKSVLLVLMNWRIWGKLILQFFGGERLLRIARTWWYNLNMPKKS